MKFILEFAMDNAAFSDGAAFETVIILRDLANRLEFLHLCEGKEFKVRDSNGNTIGECRITD